MAGNQNRAQKLSWKNAPVRSGSRGCIRQSM